MVCLWLAQHVGMFQSKGMRKVTIRLVAMEQNRPKMALMAWEIGPLGPLGPNGLGSKPPSHGGHMPLVIWCKLQHFWIYKSVIYSHIFLSLTKPIRLASPFVEQTKKTPYSNSNSNSIIYRRVTDSNTVIYRAVTYSNSVIYRALTDSNSVKQDLYKTGSL